MTLNRSQWVNAREQFRVLIDREDSSEAEWQRLFSECPYILTESLPLRIHGDDLQPLAHPGRAEPDFVFFPRGRDPFGPSGVIEIKRPGTQLLRIPRREVLCLSGDATAAIAQAQKYAMAMGGATTLLRPDELVMIGNNTHVFVIAGMSAEIAKKVTTEILHAQFQKLLPAGVLLIPYDRLLRTFESRIPPRIHVLQTSLPIAVATLDHLLRAIEQAYRHYEGFWLSEDVMAKWNRLEDEYLQVSGDGIPDTSRFIDRAQFEITSASPDHTGRRPLATEAPNPSMFALRVCAFIVQVVQSAEALGLHSSLPANVKVLWDRCGAYASD